MTPDATCGGNCKQQRERNEIKSKKVPPQSPCWTKSHSPPRAHQRPELRKHVADAVASSAGHLSCPGGPACPTLTPDSCHRPASCSKWQEPAVGCQRRSLRPAAVGCLSILKRKSERLLLARRSPASCLERIPGTDRWIKINKSSLWQADVGQPGRYWWAKHRKTRRLKPKKKNSNRGKNRQLWRNI